MPATIAARRQNENVLPSLIRVVLGNNGVFMAFEIPLGARLGWKLETQNGGVCCLLTECGGALGNWPELTRSEKCMSDTAKSERGGATKPQAKVG